MGARTDPDSPSQNLFGHPYRLFCGIIIVTMLAVLAASWARALVLLATTSEFRLRYPISIGYYSPWPLPEFGNATGLDFSQVYRGANARWAGESSYFPRSPEFRDRGGSGDRRSPYPPYAHWLYMPVSILPYKAALLLHNTFQVAILFLVTFLVLRKRKLLSFYPVTLGCYVCLLFLTPIGLSHFERGQFDLYLASAYLLCFSSALSGSRASAVTAGLLGGIKVTSVPLLLILSLFGAALKQRLGQLTALVLTLGLTIVVFVTEMPEYLAVLRSWEVVAPAGVTFLRFLPWTVARAIPVASLVIVGVFGFIRSRNVQHKNGVNVWVAMLMPFALAMGIESLGIFKVSYEYRSVSLFGFIPCLLLWCESNPHMPSRLKYWVTVSFAGFLLLALRVPPAFHLSVKAMSMTYLTVSLVFLVLTLVTGMSRGRPRKELEPRAS